MSDHDKPCTLCSTPRPVLVRCQIDETGAWHFVCPGACWRKVSGGEEDARGFEREHPFYRYGGMWKNKHADGPTSAKKPKRVKKRQKELRAARQRQQVGAAKDVDGEGQGGEREDERTALTPERENTE
nr:hypothetical protein CFP56_22033 [Quercus suber]